MEVARRTLAQSNDLLSVQDVLRELLPLKIAFPGVVKLLVIALTIAVSSAQCERTFSVLKRNKSFLRTTMCDKRLNDLSILSIERELTDELSLDTIVDKFATKNRRIAL